MRSEPFTEAGAAGSTGPRLPKSECSMRRVYPTIAPSRTFHGNDIQGELFIFRQVDSTDMEFSISSHLIIVLPDGIPGVCECNSGDRINTFHSIAPNTVIFNPALKYLRLRAAKTQHQYRVLLLTIDPAVLTQLGEDYREQFSGELCPQIGMDDPAARQALAAIQQEVEDPSANSGMYVKTFLMLVVMRLLKYQFQCPKQLSLGHIKGGLPHWRLKRALQLIENNCSRIPPLSELAGAVNLHEASFCRAFKQSTGLSPHHYLLVHRIDRAKEMMKDPSRTLTDIALDCGFNSSSQFSVVFKRIVGRPPRNYRRAL